VNTSAKRKSQRQQEQEQEQEQEQQQQQQQQKVAILFGISKRVIIFINRRLEKLPTS
jgi:hypothetical protein